MELLGGNGHGVPGRSTQGKSHGLSSSSRCKLRCSAHHCLQAVHLPSWQQQSASRASIRWKMRTAERGKRRGGRGFACGPSQLRLSGGRPTGRVLLTLTILHCCINFSKDRPPPRSEGCGAFYFSCSDAIRSHVRCPRISFTNVPSDAKTCSRSLARSQT